VSTGIRLLVWCSYFHIGLLIQYMQDVPGGKDHILGSHNISHSKQKSVYIHVSYSEWFLRQLFLSTVVWIWCPILSFPPAILCHCLKHVNLGKHQLAVVTVDNDIVGVL
jgi:hypothetical protein